jgi:hypothetical protein
VYGDEGPEPPALELEAGERIAFVSVSVSPNRVNSALRKADG